MTACTTVPLLDAESPNLNSMLQRSAKTSLRPLIVICGTTGVGKSKLAVDLASHISDDPLSKWAGAKIVNADAMQAYKGLDVLTNKLPEDERQGIEHLLMDLKVPGEQYVVGQWVQDAIKTIDEMHKRKQVPIVVGGTSYWLQHLIFPDRLAGAPDPFTSPDASTENYSAMDERISHSLDRAPSELRNLFDTLPENAPSASDNEAYALSLYKLLNILDPEIASTWHWRDTRKRALSYPVNAQKSPTVSQLKLHCTSKPYVAASYDTLCLWLYADMKNLNVRLRERVDTMMQAGLLVEVQELKRIAGTHVAPQGVRSNLDYTLGIYQSIGFRELNAYLDDPNSSQNTLDQAIESMKVQTRQYAKRQVAWIRNKLLPAFRESCDDASKSRSVYLLDATELGNWKSNVFDIASRISDDFIYMRDLPDPLSLSDMAKLMLREPDEPIDPSAKLVHRRKVVCPTCTIDERKPVMIHEGKEWEAHARSKAHRHREVKAKRLDALQN